MDMDIEKIADLIFEMKQHPSSVGLSSLTAVSGIGLEALSHNPAWFFGGIGAALIAYNIKAGDKLVAFKRYLDNRNAGLPRVDKMAAPKSDTVAAPKNAGKLCLGKVKDSGERLDVSMNALLGKGLVLAGGQESGKSNIVGLIADSAGQCDMSFVLIDYKGEFYTVRDVVPNGVVAAHPSESDRFGAGFYALTMDNAFEFAQIIMETGLQVIIDYPSYAADPDQFAEIISELFDGLMSWATAYRRETSESPWPCLIITDEAHNFVPQDYKLSGIAYNDPKNSYQKICKAYATMCNTGRFNGYTMVMATQRLVNIAKWSIGNLQNKIILKHNEMNDINRCIEEMDGLVTPMDLKALTKGIGIIRGFGLPLDKIMTVNFDKQRAKHISNTPLVEDLQRRGTTNISVTRRKSMDVNTERLPGTTAFSRSVNDVAYTDLSTKRMPDLPLREHLNSAVEPVNARSETPNVQGAFTAVQDAENTDVNAVYTQQQLMEVVRAHRAYTKEFNKEPARRDLIDYMNKTVGKHWNKGKYNVFQAICDDLNF